MVRMTFAMKMKWKLAALLIVAAVALIIWALLFRKPSRLADLPIRDTFAAELAAAVVNGDVWPRDPLAVVTLP